MTPVTVTTAPSLRHQVEEADLTPGQLIIVLGWVHYAYRLHAVYAGADGWIRSVPAHLVRVEPNDQSEAA